MKKSIIAATGLSALMSVAAAAQDLHSLEQLGFDNPTEIDECLFERSQALQYWIKTVSKNEFQHSDLIRENSDRVSEIIHDLYGSNKINIETKYTESENERTLSYSYNYTIRDAGILDSCIAQTGSSTSEIEIMDPDQTINGRGTHYEGSGNRFTIDLQ